MVPTTGNLKHRGEGRRQVEQQARRLQETLRRLSIKLVSLMNNVLSRGQLNLPQYNALTTVAFDGPLSMGQLTEALCVSTAATTHIADRLVQMDLVKRSRQERDRRVVLVEATPKGRRTVEQIHREAGAIFSRLLEALSPAERKQLVNVYERLTNLVWELRLEERR